MAINLDLVGVQSDPMTFTYGWKDTILYALGVGAKAADELDFLFEMNGPKVLPTFAVVPSFTALVSVTSKLGANPTQVLHGEQKVILHRPIPPAGEMTTVATVTGIYDKGKGALAVVEANTSDRAGDPLFTNVFSIFVRGEGGFGGDRGPEALKADPPEGAEPDFEVTEVTSPEQALLYRLSGDYNPLHASPQVAKMAGFDRPILHGLCTYGFAGRAILKRACGGDPARFRSFAARFSGVVMPGDTLTTRGWRVEPGRYVIQTTTQDGRVVISNSVAEVAQ
ncbi:MAG: 3-alpha,7-alpha,12-alpha-trihydroxy-5-beta-cholest-24-enoyl-CoA hydratase [Deltaproteobacteria bacterium]|nr:MAG: 3-alpha,7-alpha,12-alpha-trihydroxy-5-beta-cholest-24-enoyl-CoA hydratase [Deltaproteobacteria bacterium]